MQTQYQQSSGLGEAADNPNQTQFQQHIYEQRLMHLQDLLDQARKESVTMAQDLDKQRAKASDSERQTKDLKNQIEQLQGQMQTLRHQFLAEQDKNDLVRSNETMYRQKMAELEERLSQQSDEYAQEIRELRNKVRDLILDNSQKDFEITALKSSLDNRERQTSQASEEKESLLMSLDDKVSQVQKLQSELNKALEHSSDLQRDKQRAERELTLQSEKHQSQAEEEERLRAKLQEELLVLRVEVQKEKQRQDQSEIQERQLYEDCQRLESQRSTLESNLDKAQSLITKLEWEHQQTSKVQEKLTQDKDKCLKELNSIKEKYKYLTMAKTNEDMSLVLDDEQIQQFKTEFQAVFEKDRELGQKVEDSQKKEKYMEDQLKKCKEVIITQSKQLRKMEEVNKALVEEKKSFSMRLDQERRQFIALSEALKRRQIEFVLLRDNYSILEQAVKEVDLFNKAQMKFNQLKQKHEVVSAFTESDIQSQDKSHEQLAILKADKKRLEQETKNLQLQVKQMGDQLNRKEDQLKQIFEKQQQKGETAQLMTGASMLLQPQESSSRQFLKVLEEKVEQVSELRFKVTSLQGELDTLKSKSSATRGLSPLEANQYVRREDYDSLRSDYNAQSNQIVDLRNERVQTSESLRAAEQRVTSEVKHRQFFESKCKDYEALLAKAQQDKEELQRALLTGGNVHDRAQTKSQFDSLQAIINDVMKQKEALSAEIRSRDIEDIKNQTKLRNYEIMVESLRLQVKREQESRKESETFMNDLIKSQQSSLDTQQQSRSQQDQKSQERKNEELKQLLMTQKEANEEALKEREALIEQLDSFIKDISQQQSAKDLQFEAEIKRISEGHRQEIQLLTEKSQALEEENLKLNAEKNDLAQQIEAFNKEREKLQVTGEIQNHELQRRSSATEYQSQQALSPSKMSDMSERVDNLQIQYFQKEQECERLRRELEMRQGSFDDERRLIHDEVDSLKEKETALKRQLQIVQKHLDDMRQANLELAPVRETAEQETGPSNNEIELMLRERIDKLEAEIGRVRGQNYTVVEKFNKLTSLINEKDFSLTRAEEQLRTLQQQNLYKSFQLRQLEDLNDQNQQLMEEKNSLREELETLKSKPAAQVPSEECSLKLTTIQHELSKFQEMYENLKKEITKEGGQAGTSTAVSQPPIFKSLFIALQRAKGVLETVLNQLVINEEKLPKIGKRQRTE